jgi:hypothetical protein
MESEPGLILGHVERACFPLCSFTPKRWLNFLVRDSSFTFFVAFYIIGDANIDDHMLVPIVGD